VVVALLFQARSLADEEEKEERLNNNEGAPLSLSPSSFPVRLVAMKRVGTRRSIDADGRATYVLLPRRELWRRKRERGREKTDELFSNSNWVREEGVNSKREQRGFHNKEQRSTEHVASACVWGREERERER
jgi:hypothetical protein